MAAKPLGLRRWWIAALAAGGGLLVAPRALANVGVPMLVLLWPVAVMAFVPVVGVEAVVARRVIGGSWRAAWKVAFLANLVTTIVGLPVTWFLMLLVQFVAYLVGQGLGVGAEWNWIAAPFVMAWLPPTVETAPWWIGLAGAAFSIPLFFASVWIERRVGRRVLVEVPLEAVRRWSWWANGWTYAGLVLFWVGVGVKWYFERPAG